MYNFHIISQPKGPIGIYQIYVRVSKQIILLLTNFRLVLHQNAFFWTTCFQFYNVHTIFILFHNQKDQLEFTRFILEYQSKLLFFWLTSDLFFIKMLSSEQLTFNFTIYVQFSYYFTTKRTNWNLPNLCSHSFDILPNNFDNPTGTYFSYLALEQHGLEISVSRLENCRVSCFSVSLENDGVGARVTLLYPLRSVIARSMKSSVCH